MAISALELLQSTEKCRNAKNKLKTKAAAVALPAALPPPGSSPAAAASAWRPLGGATGGGTARTGPTRQTAPLKVLFPGKN